MGFCLHCVPRGGAGWGSQGSRGQASNRPVGCWEAIYRSGNPVVMLCQAIKNTLEVGQIEKLGSRHLRTCCLPGSPQAFTSTAGGFLGKGVWQGEVGRCRQAATKRDAVHRDREPWQPRLLCEKMEGLVFSTSPNGLSFPAGSGALGHSQAYLPTPHSLYLKNERD